jgi:hypothetical protein
VKFRKKGETLEKKLKFSKKIKNSIKCDKFKKFLKILKNAKKFPKKKKYSHSQKYILPLYTLPSPHL